ncbi:MAG: T9SS C-terminal target domain-containing protein [Bacteroidetes bacterium]|nr:MAG: T9SS C-terminal target domain-containing protein [Bacteroidota bacterium]
MKSYTLLCLACSFFLIAGLGMNRVSAQSVEGLPDYAWTDWGDYSLEDDSCVDETKTLPIRLLESTTPSIVAAPNPVGPDGWMRIWYNQLVGTSQLMVVNAAGQLIHQTMVGSERDSRGVYSLRSSNLMPGVYFILLKSGAYEAIEKVIIN